MSTVHLTLRIRQALADRADALAYEGEKKAALYNRIIEAGLEALEGEPNPTDEGEPTPSASGSQKSERDALRLAVETLSKQLERQGEQLTAALDQNAALTDALKREQETAQASLTLQGISQAKQLEENTEQTKRPGFWRRFFGRWGTDDETQA